MAEIEEDKFDELCRLCASYDAVQMDIFGEKGRERKIIDKIHTCLPFQVKERDLLPKSICYRCMYNLENFFDFRKGCVDAVTRLEKFVENSKRNKFVNGECMTSTATDEDEEPNPADFLEACLVGESVGNGVQTDAREEMSSAIVVDFDCLPQRIAIPPDDFTCQTCGRTFNSRGALTQHSKYHTGESDQTQVYTCHVCEKAFSSKGHLASHSKVHIGDLADRPTPVETPSSIGALRPFKCDLCEKSYSMAKHLWGHVSVSHKGDPKVTCQFCSRTFSTIANLEDHKKYKHNIEIDTKDIKPEKVDVKLDTRDDEDSAKVEENNSSQSVVEEQGGGGSRRKSSKPRKIKREVVNHTDLEMKDEPLDLATTSSTAAVTEEESSRSETTDKSLGCLFCEGVFPSRALLNQHLLDKHEINPEDISTPPPHEDVKMAENMLEAETVFCCEICVRDFNDRASLWLHMLYSHREEAATACGICLRVCSDNVSLMEHVYSCHPKDSLTADQKRYSCQICGRQLDSKKKLLTHVRIHNLYDDTGQILDPESVIVLNNKNRQIPPSNSQVKENNQFEMQHEVFTEEGQLIMSCEICYKVFPNEEKLVKHKQNAHRNSQGPNSINSSTTYFLYFSCELCGLAHSTRTERWRHMFTCHAEEPTLLCDQEKCGKVFPTRALRAEHVSTHHNLQGDTPNTCEICGKLWATRVNYWKHMMSVHADCLPFICGVCLKIFCSVPDLSAHVREKHWPLSGGDYCCDICGRPYPNKSKMFRHRKIHVLPEAEGGLPAGHELEDIPAANESRPSLEVFDQLTCSLCPDEEFLCLEDLSKHRKTAHNLVPCDLCPKFYGRSSHLWKHVNKIHKNHPDITCSVCFRTSASRNHLANHIAKHHRHEVLCQNYIDICELSNEEAVHNCVKCNKVFRKHLLLKKHMKHCTGPPNQSAPGPSPCERCSKVFDSPIQLRKHLRNSHLHFRCELCEDVAHDSRIELMDHIKEAHAGHPSLSCDYKGCGMMLRCKSDLAKHRREHRQGRPPPTCSFCGELTPNKMKLRNHLKTQHPLLTKHLCSICLVTMKDFDELRKHVRSKHKSSLGKTNICPICVRSYSNKSKVLVHIRSHGEGFFPCEICVKVFRDPEKHKRHTDAHFDENSEELEAEEEEEEEEEDAANQEQEEEEGDGEDEEETVKDGKEKRAKKTKAGEDDDEEEDEEEEEEEEEGEGEEEDEETKTEDVESVITKRTSDDEDADEKEDVSSSQIEIEDDDTNETVPVKRQRRTHPCIACSKTFTNSTSFLRHMKADHVELICACGKMSENIQSHNNHLKKCITGKKKESGKAQVEEKRTPNRRSLERKFLNSDSKGMTTTKGNTKSVNKPTNSVVNQFSSSSGSGKREVRRVYKSDDGLCSCELCKKQFEAKRHLWQHLRRFHLKEAASSCGVCLKVCKDYESLDSHLAIEHKNNFEGEGKNFTCRVCGRYHNSRSKLEQHSVIHPGQEMRTHAALHSCPLCPTVFNSATSLAVHQSTDHKEKSDKAGDEKMELDVPDHDEDSRSSTSSSSSANSSCSSSSGSSSSSSGSSSSSSTSSSSSSSGSSSSSSNSSEEGEEKDSKDSTKSKDSKVSKLSPLLKQAQRRPEKSAWSSVHKEAVNRSSERNRNLSNNFKTSSPTTHKPNDVKFNKIQTKSNKMFSGKDNNCVQSGDNDEDEDDNDVIVLSDENNANSGGAFNNSEGKFVEDNVNLSEDSSASSGEDEDDEAVRSVAGLEKDMSATAEV